MSQYLVRSTSTVLARWSFRNLAAKSFAAALEFGKAPKKIERDKKKKRPKDRSDDISARWLHGQYLEMVTFVNARQT